MSQKMVLLEKKQEDWIVSLVVSMVILILRENEENSPTSVAYLVMKTKNNNLMTKDLLLKMTKMLSNKIQLTQLIGLDNPKLSNLLTMKSQIPLDHHHKEDQFNVGHNLNSTTSKEDNNPPDNNGHEQDQLLQLQDPPKVEMLFKTCSALPMVLLLLNHHLRPLLLDLVQHQPELAQPQTQDQTLTLIPRSTASHSTALL